MSPKRIAPYGTWESPITPERVVRSGVRFGDVVTDGSDVYWTEGRSSEGGRNVLMRWTAGGEMREITPSGFNVRSRVHEYGGGAFAVRDGTIFFVDFSDQRVYRQDGPGADPAPLTPADGRAYADLAVDPFHGRLLAVCEDPRGGKGEPVNSIVSIPTDGGEPEVCVEGHDFFSSMRVDPRGRRLCWLAWDHPNMPWDGTGLYVGETDDAGFVRGARRVAGGPSESVFQPEWLSDGTLVFVSDRNGWWNLYRWGERDVVPILEREAEFGLPQWVFGMSTYTVGDDGMLWAACAEDGVWRLNRIDPEGGGAEEVDLPYTLISSVRAIPGGVVFLGGSPVEPSSLIAYEFASRRLRVLRRSAEVGVDEGYLPRPEPVRFPADDGGQARAIFYAPRNRDYEAPEGERPPLIVMSHGGPTAATSAVLNLKTAYWTSRGFAVIDVDYGGSTGYGRRYRERLRGQWGVVDVADCVGVARFAASRGWVDPRRMVITGGSAGGYTTLCALAFHDVFAAGASYYGVSDPAALQRDTHKFESRYLDGLIGPYPEREDLYRERSPLLHADRISCPMIFFQGSEDRVVPPDQSEKMVEALRRNGIPVEYVVFEGEQHGFRRAESIRTALERELAFYRRVLRLES